MKEPYDDFICSANCLYNTQRTKMPFSSDTFIFFKGYSETPAFIMDSEGFYLVSSYEIKNFDDGTHCHYISAWMCSDLFMCLHEFIEGEAETLASYKEVVVCMDCYIEFENLITTALSSN